MVSWLAKQTTAKSFLKYQKCNIEVFQKLFMGLFKVLHNCLDN